MATATAPDHLFNLRNNFYLGAYQAAINISDLPNLSPDDAVERDSIVYRSYIALASYQVSPKNSLSLSALYLIICLIGFWFSVVCVLSLWSMRSIPLPPLLSRPSSCSLCTYLAPITRFVFLDLWIGCEKFELFNPHLSFLWYGYFVKHDFTITVSAARTLKSIRSVNSS